MAWRREHNPPCVFPDCTKGSYAKGLCNAHYKQERKGQPLRKRGWRLGPNKAVHEESCCWLILTNINGEEAARTCIDAEDLAQVQQHRWHGKEYVTTNTADEKYLHRYLLRPKKGQEVDHWDGDPLNNRRSNLHIVAPRLNKQNVLSKSKHRGVRFRKDRADCPRPWVAKVQSNGKSYHQHFATEDEAVEGVKKMRAKLMEHVNEKRH